MASKIPQPDPLSDLLKSADDLLDRYASQLRGDERSRFLKSCASPGVSISFTVDLVARACVLWVTGPDKKPLEVVTFKSDNGHTRMELN